MKPKIKKTTTESHTYDLGQKIKYVKVFVDGKLKGNELTYTGGNHLGYRLAPVYDPDLSYLENKNPFWDNKYNWFDRPLPENPEDIDVSKIVLSQYSSHTLFTPDLKVIPTIVRGDYIDAGIRSELYDLEKLHEHLSKHPQTRRITKIEHIPYYNNDSGYEKYFEIEVLPTPEQANEIAIQHKGIFYTPWDKKEKDYLGMKPFRIKDSKY